MSHGAPEYDPSGEYSAVHEDGHWVCHECEHDVPDDGDYEPPCPSCKAPTKHAPCNCEVDDE